MDKSQARSEIIAHALPLIPFDGWNQQMLCNAAVAAGYKKTDVIRIFPDGAVEAAEYFMRQTDQLMVGALKHYYFDTMKIRERIATAIRVKLELLQPHSEALRRTAAFLALPFYAHRSLKLLYETVDTIWYEIGDTSTDFNFYTKRLTLAAVYSSTFLYWMDDKSAGNANTWAFLDRRIENVMQFEKAKKRFKEALRF